MLQPVGGHVVVGPEPADVVEQHIQPRVRGENLAGQPPDLGLQRHVGDEDVHRGVARLAGDRGGARSARVRSRPVMPTRAPMEARPIAAALPIPPVPPVINTVLPVIEGVTLIVSSLSFIGSWDQGGRLREPLLRRLCAKAFRFGWESLDDSPEQPDD